MKDLLTRDDFRNAVFKRDSHTCVLCEEPAEDAHHIMERRLFDDGGYYLDNGASLCGPCHILAEQTQVSCSEIRAACDILEPVLPPHLYEDYKYTKWGDIENPNGSRVKGELFYDESVQKILAAGNVLDKYSNYVKYPRTYHLPFSLGRTKDDKAFPNCNHFLGRQVVATIKMDGENTTGYSDNYIHARSLDSDNHPSRNWVKQYLSTKLYDLPKGWRICGENLYAKHSIHYTDLESYFYLFSVWNEVNKCLSWHDVEDWANLLDMPHVPVFYKSVWNEKLLLEAYQDYQNKLGYECEGFVVRLADSFSYGNFRKSVAKYVRPNHVQTNQHWLREAVVKNCLKHE